MNRISGPAPCFGLDGTWILPRVALTMFVNTILSQGTVLFMGEPCRVVHGSRRNRDAGPRPYEIRHGYHEPVIIVPVLRERGVREKAISCGLNKTVTDRLVKPTFAANERNAPTAVLLYHRPTEPLHSVSTGLEV